MAKQNQIAYTLIRTKRKSIAIYVKDAQVLVRAPLAASKKYIDTFVESNGEWINSRLAEAKEKLVERQQFSLTYGDSVPYWGREIQIVAGEGDSYGYDRETDSFYMPPNMDDGEIKSVCIQIYRMIGKADLIQQTVWYANKMGVKPKDIKVSSAKTRWGSCSAKQNLNFSWRLLAGDSYVIDYVIVHELAHLKEMNHSPNFWRIVGRILPDYKKRMDALNTLHDKLSRQNWD
ncbi:MAG: M48 family metallopeptidase [Eubacteriaceae bacterium]|nr:M48 family metallopeptidase [Eubacteriaceae bacterium]